MAVNSELIARWALRWELLVADVWFNPGLRDRLIQDTAAVLLEYGMALPEGDSVAACGTADGGAQVEITKADGSQLRPLIVPPPPSVGDLSNFPLEVDLPGAPLSCLASTAAVAKATLSTRGAVMFASGRAYRQNSKIRDRGGL